VRFDAARRMMRRVDRALHEPSKILSAYSFARLSLSEFARTHPRAHASRSTQTYLTAHPPFAPTPSADGGALRVRR
jgi:hypothetical protein